MVSFYIDLSDYSDRKPRLNRLLFIAAAVCLIICLVSIIILNFYRSPVEWIFLVVILYVLIYIYYAYVARKTELYIRADDQCFEYKFGIFKSSNNRLLWQTIARVKIGPTYIAMYKKSGRRRKISLSWLSYAKVIEVKDKILEFCFDNGIKTEVVDFVRYSNNISNKKV